MRVLVDSDALVCSAEGTELTFDRRSGRLARVANAEMSVELEGLLIDAGCDGSYVNGSLAYHSFDPLHTWELPRIQPLPHQEKWAFAGYNDQLRELQMFYAADDLELTMHYGVRRGGVEVSASIINRSAISRLVNGIAFILKEAVPVGERLAFSFPGNVPHQVFFLDELAALEPVATGLVNPLILSSTEGGHLNIVFIDEEEKWGTGVYKASEREIHYANVAGVECLLQANERLSCGTLYLQLAGKEDPYAPIRELYRRKGWQPPTDGHTEGVLYSCHPHGTMDAGFPHRKTLQEYADEMPALKEMGIDHIWILPIFDHPGRGVYHPLDQRVIDARYGGDEGVRVFSRRLRELGMTLLFDYVPHGPGPDDPLGREHAAWASVDRDGEPKLEWDCLSFDMANPDYRRYTTGLVREHVARFDVDGGRIDCAMGGLSNWRPAPGNRPSSSSLKGGAGISKAIREGFLLSGKKPIVTPENFNPVPVYAPYTDVFYDMPLYRVLFELEEAGLEEAEYARRLTRWLHAERMSTPGRYLKLRFLGNHDTVSWVWQKARATEAYGIDKAKALWVLMAFIDGIPMIYQGDEDASIYGKKGLDLRPFFTELFHARKRWLGNRYDIEYLCTDTPIVLFTRRCGTAGRLIAINLSAEGQSCPVDHAWSETLFGQEQSVAGRIALDAYGYSLVE